MTNRQTDSAATDHQCPVDPESVSVPDTLTSDGAKLVYLYLQVTGESTLREIDQSLELKTISLLPILNALEAKNLVDREGDSYLVAAT